MAKRRRLNLATRLPCAAEPEWLDGPGHQRWEVAQSLGDLRWLNRWFGGTYLTVRALARLTADLSSGSKLGIVDVATGGADVPEAVAAWGQRRRLTIEILGIDLSPVIADIAARGGRQRVRLAVADALRLPLGDRSRDVATCSLAVHHFDPGEAVRLLRELGRVATRGVVVNDLIRGPVGFAGAWLLAQVLTRNRLTRHDGPLSVRRAYTLSELKDLAEEAGFREVTIAAHVGYRAALVLRCPA
ncbi:MAG: methyltransferase domain-containing protein [Chloroflexi bacterium]|nr:methyltransferase domain-containing protein [Chloroflexota bacterium]